MAARVEPTEKAGISGLFEAAESYRKLRRGGSVARARNACRKLSTGMMRSPCAYRLASCAFSPAGTRKTSTCARRAPIVFCFTPPIGLDGAVRGDLAGRGDPVAAVDVAAELLHQVEREREPGGRAADAAGVDRTGNGSFACSAWRDGDPDQRALLVLAGRRPSSPRRCRCPFALAHGEPDDVAGPVLAA